MHPCSCIYEYLIPFLACSLIPLYEYITVYLLFDNGHLGSSQFMAIMNKTIIYLPISLGKCPGKDCGSLANVRLIVIVVQSLSCIRLSVNTWAVSMRFPRQESWSGLSFHSPVGLPVSGIELAFTALAGRFFTTLPPEKSMGLSL